MENVPIEGTIVTCMGFPYGVDEEVGELELAAGGSASLPTLPQASLTEGVVTDLPSLIGFGLADYSAGECASSLHRIVISLLSHLNLVSCCHQALPSF